jgi:probable blue pigment (indigoidine) exporter
MLLPAGASLDAVGGAAAVGAATVFAAGLVLSKRWPSPAPLVATTGWQLAAGGLLALPFALGLEGLPASLTVANLAGYAYLSMVGAAVAYLIWLRGVRVLSATRVTFLALLSPVVATALDWTVRGRHLTPLQVVGGVIALGSVVATQLQKDPASTSRAIAPSPKEAA